MKHGDILHQFCLHQSQRTITYRQFEVVEYCGGCFGYASHGMLNMSIPNMFNEDSIRRAIKGDILSLHYTGVYCPEIHQRCINALTEGADLYAGLRLREAREQLERLEVTRTCKIRVVDKGAQDA